MAKKSKTSNSEIKKNTVLFLVEGDSDQHALEYSIQELFDVVDSRYRIVFAKQKQPVEVVDDEDDESIVLNEDDENSEEEYDDDELDDDEKEKFGGDVTTAYGVWPKNIEYIINNRFFVPVIHKENLYAKRLLKVIQIVDLDGAYIPDESLVPYEEERYDFDKFFYNTERQVIEGDPIKAAKRNYHKRKNIDALVSKNVIHIQGREVPYSIYYFSSNLDHVINQDANLNGGKVNAADRFAEKYYDDLEGFLTFFDEYNSGEFRGLDYEESWNLVRDRTKTYSIQPGTNLHLLLREILEKRFSLPK